MDPAVTAPAPLVRESEYRASPGTQPLGAPTEERIFVNRNLRMRSIGAVGFDLDYTLAHYRVHEIDHLAFRITQQKLVAQRGHPREILEARFDPDFLVRGLIVDRLKGNVLKMDYHNYVVRAVHGFRALTDVERKRTYRARRIRTSAKRYASIDTFFHLPEIYLYLALVELYETGGVKPDHTRLHRDVREMIDEAHADGSIKSEIAREPGRFVSPDPRLPRFLDTLREEGKKVFLLTNSEPQYTDLLMSHLLDGNGGPAWRTRFDLVVVDAGKPRFFRERGRTGTWLDESGPGAPMYSGGDVANFERLLGFKGDSILYWGDHTYGDILRSKKSVGWRTAMIIPELEQEILVSERIRPSLDELDEAVTARERVILDEQSCRTQVERLSALLEGSAQSAPEARQEVVRKLARMGERLAFLEGERARLHALVARLDDECNAAYHRHWGPLFREGNEISRFGHQVKDFACIYTTRVSNLLHYPPNTYFRSPRERMPHEL
ncbi:MAG: HAD-IG family 5'-nucleotidase [bacterium]